MEVLLFTSYQLFMLLEDSSYSNFTEARIILVQNMIKEKLVKQACLLSSADEMRVIVAPYRICSGVSADRQSWCALCLPHKSGHVPAGLGSCSWSSSPVTSITSFPFVPLFSRASECFRLLTDPSAAVTQYNLANNVFQTLLSTLSRLRHSHTNQAKLMYFYNPYYKSIESVYIAV